MRLAVLLIIFCGLFSARVSAEGGCPPGQYPQNGQGVHACIPIPGNNQNTPNTPIGDVWIPGWQAIATDTPKGILGTATHKLTQETAEQAALGDCKEKGGSDCRLEASYGNGCLAMVTGAKYLRVRSGSSKEAAEKHAMKDCEASDSSCTVYYSDCSFPVKQ